MFFNLEAYLIQQAKEGALSQEECDRIWKEERNKNNETIRD